MIRDAGFKFIRMDFGWGGIERKKGEYNWGAYEELTDNLDLMLGRQGNVIIVNGEAGRVIDANVCGVGNAMKPWQAPG